MTLRIVVALLAGALAFGAGRAFGQEGGSPAPAGTATGAGNPADAVTADAVAATGEGGFAARIAALEQKAKEIGISISGSLSLSYNYNLAGPDSRINRIRVFDAEANEFNANLLDLVIQKKAEEPGAWGFRADLDFGEDAAIFQAAGFADGDNFELQQAYVTWVAPVGDGLTLTLGKFVSLHGAEVIESADDMNTSRSFLFGFAEPATHTGFLASYTFFKQVCLIAGVVNGWDNVDDNNDAKTFHGCLRYTPCDTFNLTVTGSYGAEQPNNTRDHRGFLGVTATATPTRDWTFVLAVDWAQEEHAGVGVDAGEDATWQGFAGYVQYQLCPAWSVRARYELFDDPEGARLGVPGQTVQEATLTLSWRPVDPAEVRLEFRHDVSDQHAFDDGDRVQDARTQDTLSLEAIFRF
ncbi:MAG: porin [Planctomycetes bacterium]|nr:porin [Planctomycetota bacterium]